MSIRKVSAAGLAQGQAEEGAVLLSKVRHRIGQDRLNVCMQHGTIQLRLIMPYHYDQDISRRPSSSSPHAGGGGLSKSSQNTLALLWLGQFVSLLGTEISKFSLRIWSYEKSGSSAEYAGVIFFTEMPSILMSPLTGPIVDRFK